MRCRCHSRARASLRNRRQGLSSMGSEDEAEQSLPRRCRQSNGRTKRTHELASSIVPRGTSFHCWVELEFPPNGQRKSRHPSLVSVPSKMGYEGGSQLSGRFVYVRGVAIFSFSAMQVFRTSAVITVQFSICRKTRLASSR